MYVSLTSRFTPVCRKVGLFSTVKGGGILLNLSRLMLPAWRMSSIKRERGRERERREEREEGRERQIRTLTECLTQQMDRYLAVERTDTERANGRNAY